jgi:hypothetical protein
VNFDFKGDLNISAGGGDLQLTATIGTLPILLERLLAVLPLAAAGIHRIQSL